MELSGNVNNLDGDAAVRYAQEEIRRARFRRRMITFAVVLGSMFVLMVGCGIAVGAATSSGTASTAHTATSTPAPTVVLPPRGPDPIAPMATSAPEGPAPAPVVPETDATAAGIYDEGTYVVGRDIAPGDYWTAGPTTDGYVSWRRLSGLGGTSDETIALDSVEGPAQITISASDRAVQFYGPCQWTKV